MYDLEGRTALITGAASGIGRAIAVRLAREGCDVGLFDIAEPGMRETARLVEDCGRRAAVAVGDVADRDAVDRGAAALRDVLGPADILVNSAGVLRIGAMLELAYSDFSDLLRINVDGTFHMCQAVVPEMVVRRQGNVINLASWLGKTGMKHYGGYVASKFAVIGMTQTLALEVAEASVRVNALCPGLIVDTGMRERAEVEHRSLGLPSADERVANIPCGRHGTPDDVARLAAFLASGESEFMTGQAINVTGGSWLS